MISGQVKKSNDHGEKTWSLVQKSGPGGWDLKTQWVYVFRSINTFVFVCCSWVNVTCHLQETSSPIAGTPSMTNFNNSHIPYLPEIIYCPFPGSTYDPRQRCLRHLFFCKKSFHEFQAQKVKLGSSPGNRAGDFNVHSVSYRDVGRSYKHACFPQMEEIGMGCFASRVWNQVIYFTTFLLLNQDSECSYHI